ncbi:uncharacterized protein LOC129725227 [Wyeomyia smithii]|uniref:uncharacterized protein LOC129725227 n=1 Tax=Wyeomyia smithii TaxID=174621 RepID=UPI0024681A14|nr:uncharacterized protein LOC129725227 [Wyeomyia smithii]
MSYLVKAVSLIFLLIVIAITAECAVVTSTHTNRKRPRPSNSPNSRIACDVSIRKNLPLNAPVFSKNGELEVPSGGVFEWEQHESVDVLCYDRNNKLVNTKRPQDAVQRYNGQRFRVGPSITTISAIECENKNTGDVEATKLPCAGSGLLRHVGFRSKTEFLKLYESCVDEAKAAVLYTHHKLYGTEIKSKTISKRVDFKSESFPRSTNPRTAYTQNEQVDRLAKLLKSPSAAKKYVNATLFLQRGHLTPDGDQLLNTWQWATYFYINVAPMWSTINTGSWKKLEETVREFASRNRLTLDVYTGTDGVLQLQGVPFTLDRSNRIPVPRWLWKIVKHQNTAIVFVVSNNPFQNDAFPCGSKNVGYNWLLSGVVEKMAFCTVAEARRHFKSIPSEAQASNVLKYK